MIPAITNQDPDESLLVLSNSDFTFYNVCFTFQKTSPIPQAPPPAYRDTAGRHFTVPCGFSLAEPEPCWLCCSFSSAAQQQHSNS